MMLRSWHNPGGRPRPGLLVLVVPALLLLTRAGWPQPEMSLEEQILGHPAFVAGDPEAYAEHLLQVAEANPSEPAAELALRMLLASARDLSRLQPFAEGLARIRTSTANGLVAEMARYLESRARLEAHDDAAAVELARAYQALGPWAVIGTFGDRRAGSFDDQLAPEVTDDPRATFTSRGRQLSWRLAVVPDAREVSLRLVELQDRGIAYGRTVFRLPEELTGALHVEVASPCKVWIDGELVHIVDRFREYGPNEQVVPVQLAAGTHLVLVKALDEASVAVQLVDQRGFPVGLERLDPLGEVRLKDCAGVSLQEETGATLALEYYRTAPREGRAGAWNLLAFATLASQHGEADEAIEAHEEAALRLPDEPAALLLCGRELLDTRLRPRAEAENQAREHFQRAWELAPEGVAAAVELASFEQNRDRHREARALLREALTLAPGSRALRTALAELYRSKRWLDEAREILQGLVQEEPGDLVAWRDLSRIEETRDNHPAVREITERLLGERPGDESLQARRVSQLEDLGDQASARRLQEQILARTPDSPDARQQMLELLLRQDAGPEALQVLATLEEDRPWDGSLRARRAEILILQGRQVEAAQAIREALQIDPSQHDLREYLAYLTSTEHDFAAPYLTLLDEMWDEVPTAQDYPKAASVLFLDEAVLRLYPDGSCVSETYACRKVLSPDGIDRVARASVPGELIEARTHQPDGTILEPIRLGGGGLQMPGVDVGSVVELRYLTRNKGVEGRFPDYTWSFQDRDYEEPYYLSRLVVMMPDDMEGLRVETRNFEGEYEETRVVDLRVLSWEVRGSPRILEEAAMPSPDEVIPTVRLESPASWEEIYSRGRGLDAGARITPPVRARAHELAAGVDNPLEQARLLYGFVNEHVEQDSGANPTVTLLAGQGNRQHLFAALGRSVGLDIRYMEKGPHPMVDPPVRYEFPGDIFDPIPVLALRTAAAGTTYLDFSSRYNPFGAVSPEMGGCLALVHGLNDSELTVLPADPPPHLLGVHTARLRVTVTGEMEWTGVPGGRLKRVFETMDPRVRRMALTQLLGRDHYPGIEVTELELPAVDELGTPFRFTFTGHSRKLLVPRGGHSLVQTGFGRLQLQASNIRESVRTFDYVGRSRVASLATVEITLEPGVELVEVPAPTNLMCPLGHLRQRFTEESRGTFRVEREYLMWPGRLTPEEYPMLMEFCRDGDRAGEEGLILDLPR
jgi:tetratricopeptide (TPR) repeat protein